MQMYCAILAGTLRARIPSIQYSVIAGEKGATVENYEKPI